MDVVFIIFVCWGSCKSFLNELPLMRFFIKNRYKGIPPAVAGRRSSSAPIGETLPELRRHCLSAGRRAQVRQKAFHRDATNFYVSGLRHILRQEAAE